MTPHLNTLDLARRFVLELQKLESGDSVAADSLAGLFAPDAHLTNSLLQSEGRERKGRGEVAEFWRRYRASFQQIHSEFSHLTTSERAAGLFWRSRGSDAQGQPLEYDGVSLLEFDAEGRIARFQGYFDSRQLVRSGAGAQQPEPRR